MKSLLILSLLSISATVFSAETYDIQYFAQSNVIKVNCEEPSHRGHDESIAGTAKIRTFHNEVVEVRIMVSRFEDENAEAKALCDELKAAMKSKKRYEVIVQKVKDYSSEEEKYFYDVKGVKVFHGMNFMNI